MVATLASADITGWKFLRAIEVDTFVSDADFVASQTIPVPASAIQTLRHKHPGGTFQSVMGIQLVIIGVDSERNPVAQAGSIDIELLEIVKDRQVNRTFIIEHEGVRRVGVGDISDPFTAIRGPTDFFIRISALQMPSAGTFIAIYWREV